MSISHPVLKYYGSKFRLAKWIIEHFPKHRHYVEPFGGAANVLLVKDRSRLETYNDLENEIVNFFRILRDRPVELVEKVRLTPWARKEFESCIENASEPLERARRLFFRLWMSIQGGVNPAKGSFRRHNTGRTSIPLNIKPENLFVASERLTNVVIESKDAFKLISELDSPDTLFYIDPPYVKSTRADTNVYSYELSDEQHKQLSLLRELSGMVVLSGYACKIYTDLFESHGWQRVDREASVNGGGKRIESLWLSPTTSAALK